MSLVELVAPIFVVLLDIAVGIIAVAIYSVTIMLLLAVSRFILRKDLLVLMIHFLTYYIISRSSHNKLRLYSTHLTETNSKIQNGCLHP